MAVESRPVKIRSITAFEALDGRPIAAVAVEAGKFLRAARRVLTDEGFAVQTVRLALGGAGQSRSDLTALAGEIEAAAADSEIDFVSLGAIPTARLPGLADALAATTRVFASANVAGQLGPDWRAIDLASEVIQRLSRSTPDGFGNLRFAATAGCRPHIPFFPAAEHDGGGPAMGLALEAADLVGGAVASVPARADVSGAVARAFDAGCLPLESAARRIARRRGRRYVGIDVSPAPFPEDDVSLAGAIEAISGAPFGGRGTVAAAAAIVHGLRASRVERAGFSGLMLPVLEDSILARRSREGTFDLADLLLCSTVCGTGLDTVPLPGSVAVEEIAAIIGEVAALSVALAKPLTARLLPVPGLVAGDVTRFDFPYFANGAVLSPLS